ncbi:type IV conjugative transfer system pilin TraA [Vibrio cyclitrophicus]|uniref:Pilin n=2 Tax=Vibrio cyclitrophicus TaxID=47951 RepID=A0A7Z1MK65_9VIBR|nr:type IV conjugative transfer system pilin TraA [Vibrio cyclitrophicus]PMP21129.1 hypothetical protein BCS91_20570 [Vibrio cyclitrophicus]PMP30524.1 hypothetical protein BCS90_14580 [Vibrio cyclitrophicus]
MKTMAKNWIAVCCVAFGLVMMPQLAFAADLFAAGRQDIIDNVGTGSVVELAILSVGGVGALIFGYLSKNWVGAIGGFAVGVIFWNIASTYIGI